MQFYFFGLVFLTIIFVLGFFAMNAQIPVTINFNSTNTGRSINVLASKLLGGRHELGGGLCFNINNNFISC